MLDRLAHILEGGEHSVLDRLAHILEGGEHSVLLSCPMTFMENGRLGHCLTKQLEADMGSQLLELVKIETSKTMFPCLNTFAYFCLSILFGTASVEYDFYVGRIIKTPLQNRLGALTV